METLPKFAPVQIASSFSGVDLLTTDSSQFFNQFDRNASRLLGLYG